MNYLLKQMFLNRNYPDDFLKQIEKDRNYILKDIDVLVDILYAIKNTNKKIVILGDYDADGIMSTILSYAGLSELDFNVNYYIRNNLHGYEFTKDDIDLIKKQNKDVEYIITCDVGISCKEVIEYAESIGIKVLVTDHHSLPDDLPNATFILNPMLDNDNDFKTICGAFVIYQVLEKYAEKYCNKYYQAQIKRLCVFSSIATISDSMPLYYENRQLVKDGLSICSLLYANNSDFIVSTIEGHTNYVNAFKGLHKMIKYFSDLGKINNYNDINSEFYGFYLAPYFNSVKRLNGDLNKVFEIFFSGKDDLIESNLNYLFVLNEKRKDLVEMHLKEILNQKQLFDNMIYISSAITGILGLLAMRIMLKTNMPSFCIREEINGTYVGSGRSPSWYPVLVRVKNFKNYDKIRVAGHNSAFGFRAENIEVLKEFYEFLVNDVNTVIKQIGVQSTSYDYYISTLQKPTHTNSVDVNVLMFLEFLEELNDYKPFGVGIEAPEGLLEFEKDKVEIRSLGKENKHLKIILNHGFEVLLFNQAELLDDLPEIIKVSGRLGMNEYQEKITVNFTGTII